MEAIERGQFNTPLSTLDLWVSMIENWGEANKEYKHCQEDNKKVGPCFTAMSKYLSRMFNAMRLVRTRLPIEDRHGLLNFGETSDPEYATLLWLRYKKKGKSVIPKEMENMKLFLKKFQCQESNYNVQQLNNQQLSPDCLLKIHQKVNAYNTKLASRVADKGGKWI